MGKEIASKVHESDEGGKTEARGDDKENDDDDDDDDELQSRRRGDETLKPLYSSHFAPSNSFSLSASPTLFFFFFLLLFRSLLFDCRRRHFDCPFS